MPNGQSETFLKPEEKEFQKVYKRSLWLIEHRIWFKKILIIFLIILDAGLFLYTGWVFFDTFVLSYSVEQQAVANLALSGQSELHNFSETVVAKDLVFGDVFVTPSGLENYYDFSVLVNNPNSDWYATFDYSFVLKDGETISQSGFILPNEERPIVLWQGSESKPSTVELNIGNLQWSRVDSHEISDYATWASEHLALSISEVSFTRESEALADMSFLVKNNSAYNYWQPSFAVLLWRGSSLGGVMRLTTDSLNSGEEKTMVARWLGAVPAVTKIEVYPEINLFDSNAYSSLEGKNPKDIRTKVHTSD